MTALILLLALAAVVLTGAVATFRSVHVDGRHRVPTDRTRLP